MEMFVIYLPNKAMINFKISLYLIVVTVFRWRFYKIKTLKILELFHIH